MIEGFSHIVSSPTGWNLLNSFLKGKNLAVKDGFVSTKCIGVVNSGLSPFFEINEPKSIGFLMLWLDIF